MEVPKIFTVHKIGEKKIRQKLNFSSLSPTGTCANWHIPQLEHPSANFLNFLRQWEFEPPTTGTLIIYLKNLCSEILNRIRRDDELVCDEGETEVDGFCAPAELAELISNTYTEAER